MSFAAGDVVECIDDTIYNSLIKSRLVKGQRYQVIWVGPSRCGKYMMCDVGNNDATWQQKQFRKLQGPDERLRVEEMRREPVSA